MVRTGLQPGATTAQIGVCAAAWLAELVRSVE